jgi:hypothetical protein
VRVIIYHLLSSSCTKETTLSRDPSFDYATHEHGGSAQDCDSTVKRFFHREEREENAISQIFFSR